MPKSTHKGECQLCGRVQKLPSGKLSIHGYNVKWSVFVGECPGSRELPYEKSCELIKSALITLPGRIDRLQQEIDDLYYRTGTTCFYHDYDKELHAYYWREAEVIQDEDGRNGIRCAGKDRFNITSYGDPRWIARQYDEKYINSSLRPLLKSLTSYQKWCERRVEEWEEKDLTLL